MPPNILVVAGPSGVGKGTILQLIRNEFSEQLIYSISHTTRAPRPGEQHGKEYYFISKDEFETMIKENKFVEHNCFNSKYYGTSIEEIQRLREIPNRICLLEIDVNGVAQVQQNSEMQGAVLYAFIYPPSMEELETRLRKRGTENEDSLHRRLEIARGEIKAMNEMHKDVTICNDSLEAAVDALRDFVNKRFLCVAPN